MYITRDYCKSSPWTAICDMINDACLTQLNPGTTQLVSLVALGATKTQIVIDVNISTTADNSIPPVPLTTYTYDRLDLATFFKQSSAYRISGMKLPVTTMDIAKLIGKDNDIVFDLEDFIHERYTAYSPTTDLIIRASPKSLRFVGQMRVRLINTLKRDFSALGTVLEFPNVNIPYVADVTVGDFLSSALDFTVHRDLLRSLPIGWTHETGKLANILTKATGRYWITRPYTTDYNLAASILDGEPVALIRYNGPPVPEWSNSTTYNNVLVLELNPDYCPNVTGHLRLHYN